MTQTPQDLREYQAVPKGYDAVCSDCGAPYTFDNARAVHTQKWEMFCSDICENSHRSEHKTRHQAVPVSKEELARLREDAARWRKARTIFSIEDVERADRDMRKTGSVPSEEENIKADAAIDTARKVMP